MGEQCVYFGTIGRFRFRTALCFDVEPADDGWMLLSNSDIGLYATGRTMEEAEADLEETLGDILEDYVLCDESELHESGIGLREWFMENVEVVPAKGRTRCRTQPQTRWEGSDTEEIQRISIDVFFSISQSGRRCCLGG